MHAKADHVVALGLTRAKYLYAAKRNKMWCFVYVKFHGSLLLALL